MTDDLIPFVLAAFRGHGRSRSRLYWWMVENYAELSRAKEAGRRVDWISVTNEMTALGYKARKGQSLKPESVRRTWHRVDADVKAGVVVPRMSVPAPVSPPARPQPPVLPPTPASKPPPAYAEPDQEARIVEPRSRFNLKRPVDRPRPAREDDT